MSEIKIKDSQGRDLYKITTDAGKVTKVAEADGIDAAAKAAAPINAAQLGSILQGLDLSQVKDGWSLTQLLQSLGQAVLTGDNKINSEETLARLSALGDAIGILEGQLAAENGAATKDQAKIDILDLALKTAKAQLKQLFNQVKGADLTPAQEQQLKSVEAAHSALLQDPKPGKAQVGQPQPQPSQQPSAPPAQPYPGAGKAQTGFPGAGAPMDINQLLQSSMFQTMNLNSMDALGKNQMDQKKMMMLFMYFAMMAMSGDIGAMAAFMQFITTIITKDKAQQNINMANKLIELQDGSRAATDELLNTPSFDPNNPQVGSDFAKALEKAKAEEGSIATSQKLIAQMMEEFGQVSEYLHNMSKNLTEVRGRVSAKVTA